MATPCLYQLPRLQGGREHLYVGMDRPRNTHLRLNAKIQNLLSLGFFSGGANGLRQAAFPASPVGTSKEHVLNCVLCGSVSAERWEGGRERARVCGLDRGKSCSRPCEYSRAICTQKCRAAGSAVHSRPRRLVRDWRASKSEAGRPSASVRGLERRRQCYPGPSAWRPPRHVRSPSTDKRG